MNGDEPLEIIAEIDKLKHHGKQIPLINGFITQFMLKLLKYMENYKD